MGTAQEAELGAGCQTKYSEEKLCAPYKTQGGHCLDWENGTITLPTGM